MKNLKIVLSAMLLFAVLAGIGYALTPPPPPPPVPQNLGIYETSVDGHGLGNHIFFKLTE